MDIEKLKSIIKDIGIENISFSSHFGLRSKLRGIKESDIIDKLGNCDTLLEIEDQGTESRGQKYGLLFKMMSNYDLKIVISIKDKHINIVTAHIQNIRKRKAYKKWLGI